MAMTTASPSTISPLSSPTPLHRSARATHQRRDRAVPQRRTLRLGGAHQTRGEGAGSTNAVVCGEPSRPVIATLSGQPRSRRRAARGVVLDGVPAIGREPPIAPRIVEFVGEFGVKIEAPPRQSIERAAAAPVERQEAARLAGGRAGDCVTLDHDRLRAAPAEEVGDRDADRAAAADDDAFGRLIGWTFRPRIPQPDN